MHPRAPAKAGGAFGANDKMPARDRGLMVDARRDKAWMDAYLARLKPMTLEAARANYIWWCSRERGERSEEVLKWADTALDVYRRGVRFVLDEFEKVFEERLE